MNPLINYTLHLADNALILSQRNSEWCGHGPILEQDIAITNISLDLLGQARNFYQYAAELMNRNSDIIKATDLSINISTSAPVNPLTEDSLAYFRTEREFKNCLLTEQPNGDWGQTILRLFLFSTYQHLLYQKLAQSNDTQLAAIAAKAVKEVTYHVRWSSEWVVRLGNGTAESHRRMQHAIDELWAYTDELFINAAYESNLLNDKISVDATALKQDWTREVTALFDEATLPVPQKVFMHTGGKNGLHTEHLGFILAELQYMQRTYPGCEW